MIKYFIVGLILDLIVTRYTQAIQENKALLTALLSLVITLVNIFVYGFIILGTDFLGESISFALGCAVGSYIMVRKREKKVV